MALHLRVTAGGLPAFISLFQKFGKSVRSAVLSTAKFGWEVDVNGQG